MAVEIERKFLTASDAWRAAVERSVEIKQGYLSHGARASVRVRISGGRAQLGIKSSRDGIHRLEFEYPIPLDEAETLLAEVAEGPYIHKTRHYLHHGTHLWEIDEFHGDNAGLVVAEVELARADEPFERPSWLGREVSTDPRYFNSNLAHTPWTHWKDRP